MEEFTRSEINSKERQLQAVNKKVSACVGKEAEMNVRLNQLRRSGKPTAQTQRELSELEKKLSEILREHEGYERERERLSRDLERLRQSAAFEESLHREEEKRKQVQKQRRDELSRIVTFSAGAAVGAVSHSKRDQPQKRQKSSRGGCFGAVGKWLVLFVFFGALLNTITSRDPLRYRETKALRSTQVPEIARQELGLSQWIGLAVEDISAQYGEDFLADGINGGTYFYYEDDDACPYNFYYDGKSEKPEPGDRIYGVATWGEGICVVDGIRIGENIQQIEEKLGYSLAPEVGEGSDFYPFLEESIQEGEIHYYLLFGPESKNLVRATAIEKREESNNE